MSIVPSLLSCPLGLGIIHKSCFMVQELLPSQAVMHGACPLLHSPWVATANYRAHLKYREPINMMGALWRRINT